MASEHHAPHLWEHEEAELEGWFDPANAVRNEAYVSSIEQYKQMYERSVKDPAGFWGEIASDFKWQVAPGTENFLEYNFDSRKGKVFVKWMEGAVTNVCYNVLDRNVKDKGLGDKVAFFWEGNDPDDSKQITYGELLKEVCKFSNVLESKGIKKGDRIAIYMPMIVELVVAMLACARIGAIHSIVFGGFSAESLAERILDSTCSALITADGVYRGTKLINLKDIADEAMDKCQKSGYNVPFCVVVQHLSKTNGTVAPDSSPVAKRPCPNLKISWNGEVDIWWHDLMKDASDEHEPTWLDAEDPLFMLYTSGSTGKPKGVVHHVGGYMLYTATTFKYVFDYHPGDIFWCSADIGWITGHSYIVYGPMANGATSVMFEGVPMYPNPGRYWAVVDKYKVNKFYTAPTAIRALMKYGPDIVKEYDRKSLTVLGTVGEPINPEAWLWYYHVVGEERCSIVDTFWQTETGGHMLTPLPGATKTRPGSATFPFFGVVPAVLDKDGNELEGACEGLLAMKQPWPGIMRTLYNNHQRYEDVYFNVFKGYYYTGDGCRRDENGYYWITGRTDDCMNVSGHLLSTTEIENALVEHDMTSEAAVVAYPHCEKGNGIYCFVTLMEGIDFTDELVKELKQKVRKKIGPFATPDVIQNAPALPKTRSGKIMRRVLRQIAQNSREIGDLTTLADPGVIDQLFSNRPEKVIGNM